MTQKTACQGARAMFEKSFSRLCFPSHMLHVACIRMLLHTIVYNSLL